jgi:hypothetical protein
MLLSKGQKMIYKVYTSITEVQLGTMLRYKEEWDIIVEREKELFNPIFKEVVESCDGTQQYYAVLLEADGGSEQGIFEEGIRLIYKHMGSKSKRLHSFSIK